MKTEWDYTSLADAYLKRPDYSEAAIDAMISIAGLSEGEAICDVGAGVAHLTLMLASRGFNVSAVEPNDAMRSNGIKRTEKFNNIAWFEGTGENSAQSEDAFEMVTFGSSFNVCDRAAALKEVSRILKPKGWFSCMWNHRHLDDPIQTEIENIIKKNIAAYGYGSRREDQVAVINKSDLFGPVVHLDSQIIHQQTIDECVRAWQSHATLQRQAGDSFDSIISAIQEYLLSLNSNVIEIPYSTNIWICQLR